MPKILSRSTFATIRDFILREGDQQTYCNMYNHNPHFAFGAFDAFLNPEGGQRNINCDPALGGFDEIVVQHEGAAVRYTSVKTTADGVDFQSADQSSLEYYFAAMLAHISRQG